MMSKNFSYLPFPTENQKPRNGNGSAPFKPTSSVVPSFPSQDFATILSKNQPIRLVVFIIQSLRLPKVEGVEDNGFEPLTPCVQGRCSSQLS